MAVLTNSNVLLPAWRYFKQVPKFGTVGSVTTSEWVSNSHRRYIYREGFDTAAHANRATWCPPTRFLLYADGYSRAQGYYRREDASFVQTTFGRISECTNTGQPSVPSRETELVNQALIKAISKAKNRKVNFAQAFAERKQVETLVESTIKRLTDTVRFLRRGDVPSALRTLALNQKRRLTTKGLAKQWLELQYGWVPLLSDVFGAAELLRKRDADDSYRYLVTVKARSPTLRIKTEQFVGTPGVTTSYRKLIRTDTHGAMVRLDYYLQNTATAFASSTGFADPTLLAWELLPYSFVVDWFLPIGSYLDALNGANGLGFRGGSSSYKGVRTEKNEWRAGSESGPVFMYADAYGIDTNVQRRTYTTSPTPSFPGFKNPFTTSHVANALALMRVAFRR